MKNTLKFYSLIVVLALVAFSCKKKSSEEDIATLPFAKESVDEGKTNLTDAGQQMVTELNTLADAKGISGAQSMSYFMDQSMPFATSSQDAIAFAAVKTTSDYGTSKNPEGIIRFLSSNLQSEQDSTFQDLFNKRKGIYTWNNTLKKWTRTVSADKIELVFPSNKNTPTVNDGKFDITYTSKVVANSTLNSNGELPLTFNAVLYNNADKVLEYSFTAEYDNSGMPSNVTTFLALYPFKFETTLTNNSSALSVRYLFTNNTKTIFDFYAGLNGNFTQSNIEASEGPDDVISNANAYFQVFNIKLSGRIDVKSMAAKEKEIYNNDALTEEEANNANVEALNKYFALVLLYADSNQKIAQGEFYPTKETHYYYTEYSSDIRFIFADNSKGDMKSYFGTGFSALITDFNALIVKLNTKYDLGADTIKY